MSGEAIFPELELLNINIPSLDVNGSAGGAESFNLNPLHCLLCRFSLNFPISLTCHHVFCKKCVLHRRDKETNRLRCPLCGVDSCVSDPSLICDPLITYLVESANEKADVCANCDKINQPMFFCETCHQPLCIHCKDQTHQAKMFASHKIVLHEERSGAAAVKKCKNHGEPYILFCAENKSLVCINCFRTATLESRPHYVDLDTAYKVGCDKLEKIAKQLKSYQKEVFDGILLRRSMLEEIKKSTTNEINQIQILCQQMIDKLIEIRDQLLTGINKESAGREEYFRQQLNSLCALTPTIQMYLLVASIFCSSANKMDFLDLCYTLIHRIQSVINEHQSLVPSFNGQIQSNFKAEFARALEPYLGVKSVLIPNVLHRQLSGTPDCCGSTIGGDVSPASSVNSSQYFRANGSSKSGLSSRNYSKLRLLVDLAGAFGDEFGKVDSELKDLKNRFATISKSAQEIQRDLTIRRCVIDETKLNAILGESQKLKIDLGAHSTRVDDLQSTFQQIWEEQLDRVRAQQEMYRNHIGSVMCLREDLHRMVTASQQLAPFLRSIASVIEQIKPERCPNNEPSPMQKICLQINTMEPNSQNRVDAIERQELQRKNEIERKKADSSQVLMRAKGHLKTPKDPSRRKSGSDFGQTSSGGVVKVVERERGDVQLLSPNKLHKASTSPINGSPKVSKKLAEGGCCSLDESFELALSSSCCPKSLKSNELDEPETTDSNESLNRPFVEIENKEKRSSTLSDVAFDLETRVSIEPSSSLSLSLPVLVQTSGGENTPAPKVSPKTCLPPSLVASVDSATLEARERVLASLKEKVRRVDAGVN